MASSNYIVPKKGDFVVNPSTGRPIKVGNRTWKRLVVEGLIRGHYTDPKVMDEEDFSEDITRMEARIAEINKTLPPDEEAIKGKGLYKGKIIKRKKKVTNKALADYTTDVAGQCLNENIDILADSKDIEADFKEMLVSDMIKPQRSPANPRVRKKKPVVKYELSIPEEEDESSSSEEENEEEDEEEFDEDGFFSE